ncbi:MAG TPA: HAD-IA family hydrolase, partial [Candidatus Saccharimonadales bacterium]
DLAKEMRRHQIKTAIFSNIFSMNAKELRRRGMYDGFDPVILSCEVHYAKPDHEFYEYAMEQLGVPPEDILLIDDQEKCLSKARELGMKVVVATSPEQIIADTKAVIFAENGIHL